MVLRASAFAATPPSRPSEAPSSSRGALRVRAHDVTSAIVAAEQLAGATFADAQAPTGDQLAACAAAASRGERMAVLVHASELGGAREPLRAVARRGLGLVVHVLGGHGGEDVDALLDVGWGVLTSAGPESSHQLTLVARRAAEAAGVPVVVVHALCDPTSEAGHATTLCEVPHDEHARELVGPPRVRARERTDPTRDLTTALRSALDAYTHVTARRLDVVEWTASGEPDVVLVGAGAVGDALAAAVPSLRARGLDVGALRVACLRPFPGARAVKSLAHARAVVVVEPADERLGRGALARELESCFCDALTWSPGYPGIGRVPRFHELAVTMPISEQTLAERCAEALRDEPAPSGHPRAYAPATRLQTTRLRLDDPAVAAETTPMVLAVLGSVLGVRASAVERRESGGLTVDVVSGRTSTRIPGVLLARAPDLVVARSISSIRQGPPVTVGIAPAEGASALAASATGAVAAAVAASFGCDVSLDALEAAVAREQAVRGRDASASSGFAREAFVRTHAALCPRALADARRW